MAWALRRFLVFPVFGSGDYSVQPIYAEDLAVDAWSRAKSFVFDAAGQERFFFEALMRLLASVVGARVRLVMSWSSANTSRGGRTSSPLATATPIRPTSPWGLAACQKERAAGFTVAALVHLLADLDIRCLSGCVVDGIEAGT